MSKTIQLTFTDQQWAALTDITADPKDWLHNAGVARARTAASERRADPNWNAAVVSFALAGGDIADDTAIVAHGLANGLFKDAAARQAEVDAARELAFAEEDQAPA